MGGMGPAALVEMFSGILIGVQIVILTGVILIVWNHARQIGELQQAMKDLNKSLDDKRASIEGTIKNSVSEVVAELKKNGHA